jgi:uncharacterized membrane protein
MALTEFLKVFFTAAAPISELRGAIPLAILDLEVSWPLAFLVAFAGNLLPVPFILLLLDPIARVVSRVKLLDRILQAIFAISRRRGGIVERYGLLGLVVFVAIPLPVTGAWTGSIVAYLLGIEFRRAFPAIVLGVFIAGVIVTVLTEIGWWGALIAGVGFVLLVGIGFLRSRREAALSGHSGEEAMDEI